MVEATEATPQKQDMLSSVELSRGAKGETKIVVKVYHDNPDEAKREAVRIYDELCDQYGE